MENFYTITQYCEEYKLNPSRIRKYYEDGTMPYVKNLKGKIYFPKWMFKFQKNIIKNPKKVTNIYSSIMKAVNNKIHVNYKMCNVTKSEFETYLTYIAEEGMIQCKNVHRKDIVESYIPTLKLLEYNKPDYYKLANFVVESSIKVSEAIQ